MSEVSKALANFKPHGEKKHYVIIEGKKLQVSLKKKLEIMQHGEGNYTITEFGPALRKPQQPKTRYSVLKRVPRGYAFEQGDIHWPKAIVENGETWLIEYE